MKTKDSMVKLVIQQVLPVFENFLDRIAKDYELNPDELKKKYLSDMKNFRKNKKKSKPSAYSMFLSDKSVTSDLKTKFPNAKFGDLSKEKGKLWKGLNDTKRQMYKDQAEAACRKMEEENSSGDEQKDEPIEELKPKKGKSSKSSKTTKPVKNKVKGKTKDKVVETSDLSDSDLSSDDEN